MNTYRVQVILTVTDTIVVHAETPREAEAVAKFCGEERIKYSKSDTADDERDDGVVLVSAATVSRGRPGDRIDTYLCSGCDQAAPKTAYGPGWNTCPRCGAPPVPAVSVVEGEP